jgi:PAS domain S-box-containing protein
MESTAALQQLGKTQSPGLRASLDLVARASARLLDPESRLEEILPSLLDDARAIITADGYALWRVRNDGRWAVISAAGLSNKFVATSIEPSAGDLLVRETVALSDVVQSPLLQHQRERYLAEGIRSLLIAPLVVGGQVAGATEFYFRKQHDISQDEAHLATALANLTASALATAQLHERQLRIQKQSQFMAEASAVLSSSLEYETTLATVTRLAVPHLADWCAIDIEDKGDLQRLGVAHVDPAKLELAREYHRLFPPDLESGTGVGAVIRTGKPQLYPHVTEEMLVANARNPHHVAMLRELGFQAFMIMPLATRERIFGAITLVTSSRDLDDQDVKTAEDLARRAGVAIENARLFRLLRQSEQKFRTMSETVPCGIYIHDGKKLLYANPAAEELSGYSQQELASMDLFGPVHPEDRDMVTRRAAARFKGEAVQGRYQFRGMRKDGREIWLDFAGATIEYEGRPALLATAFDITEQKLAQQKLERSEREARSLLENLPDVIARYDRHLRYLYISPAVQGLTGIPAREFIGKRHAEVGLPQELCELFDHSLEKVFKNGESDVIQFTIANPDGTKKFVMGMGIPQFGPDGRVETVLTISHDLTDYRKAEEAIRRNEKELRLITDTLPALVAYVDIQQRFVRVNRTFETWFGHPQHYFIGRSLKEVLGNNYGHLEPYLEQVLRGELVQFETINQYADKRRSVMISYIPDFDERREVRGFVALVQDVSDRRSAEEASRAHEQRLQKFAEAGPAILYSNLPDGTCDFVSERFLQFTGMPLNQVLGFGWVNAIHPDDAARVESTWTQARREGSRHEVEFRFRHHDGTYHWFRAWNVPIRNELGEIVRWFGTCLDVNDQKQAEDALRKAEKLAAVGRMAASISHEINNPLEAVTNLVYLAKKDADISKRGRDLLEAAERELARVSQIATQTLRFYRQSSRPALVNVAELIDSVLHLYEGRLTNSQIKVRREYEGDGVVIEALEGELRQVLANLVGNAIDATPAAGNIRIRVRTHQRPSGPRGVRITVADNGHGIVPELKARIFEPFFTTKTATGTGLGLWVTREIIDKHQGTIRVHSSQLSGRSGTIFSIFLPEKFGEDRSPGLANGKAELF